MRMNYFLYGADTYRSRQKLHEITDAYRAKFGARVDFARINADEDGLAPLKEAAGTASLFSAKKMIVVERAYATGEKTDELAAILRKIKGSQDTIAVFWEGELNEDEKELAFIKNLMDKSQEFVLLAGESLRRWIEEEAKRRGVRLVASDRAQLALHGNNLWAVANELEKIAVSGQRGRLAPPLASRHATVFDLGDSFFTNRAAAVQTLMSLLEQGEDEMKIFSYLAGYARTLLTLKDYASRGRVVPSSSGIHPFVVKKTARLVAALDGRVLASSLKNFCEADVAVKTGIAKPADAMLRMLL